MIMTISIASIFFTANSLKITFLGVKLMYFIMFALYITLCIVLFVALNIKLIILLVLTLIFIKALSINFIAKHKGKNKMNLICKLKYLYLLAPGIIKQINIKLILKIFICLIPFRLMIRSFIYIFLDNENTYLNNNISLLLSITFICYFANIVIKWVKKDKLTAEDYYLFNAYVVEKVNIYNITYILCINQIILYIYGALAPSYSTIICLFVFMFILIYTLKYTNRMSYYILTQPASSPLLAVVHPTTAAVAFAAGSSELLKNALEIEYTNFTRDTMENPEGNTDPQLISTGSVYESNGTVSWLNEGRANIAPNSRSLLDKIERSPAKRIAERQQSDWSAWTKTTTLIHESSFVSNFVKGCVLRWKDFLFINFIKNDINSTKFMPFHYVYNEKDTVDEAVDHLKNVFSIRFKPLSYYKIKHLVIFTQVIPIHNDTIFKVYMPTLGSVDLDSLKYTWWNYFNMDERDNNTLEESIKNIIRKNIYTVSMNIPGTVKKDILEAQKIFWDNVYEFINNKPDCFILPATTPKNDGTIDLYKIVDSSTMNDKGLIEVTGEILMCNLYRCRWSKNEHMSIKEYFGKSRYSILDRVRAHIIASPELMSSKDPFYGICIRRLCHEFYLFEKQRISLDHFILIDPENTTTWNVSNKFGNEGDIQMELLTKKHYNRHNLKDQKSILKLTNYISKA